MGGGTMNFQAVVLAGGNSKKLFPLVSKDVPKALLPVANRPVLSYTLDLLEESNLTDLIVVVPGDDAALGTSTWISEAYHDRLQVEVVAVPEDAGTVDALRKVEHKLTGDDILVVSGDLVCDVSLGAIAAAHRRQRAALTAVLYRKTTPDGSDMATKDKVKQAAAADIIGLDSSHQQLLFIASGSQLTKDIRIPRSLLRAANQIEIHSDLVDAHLYAFRRTVLQDVLSTMCKLRSVKDDLVPYILHTQMNAAKEEALRCHAYVVGKGKYCARVNSIQAFGDINREVAGDGIYLTGYTLSTHNNVIDSTAVMGVKTTVGAQCIVGEGTELGDKCSVKKSVVGRHCRIGCNVKIINSVVMNHVNVEDGCHIQNSVICSNVHVEERVSMKDCEVGVGYVVVAGGEVKSQAFAKK